MPISRRPEISSGVIKAGRIRSNCALHLRPEIWPQSTATTLNPAASAPRSKPDKKAFWRIGLIKPKANDGARLSTASAVPASIASEVRIGILEDEGRRRARVLNFGV